MFIQLFLETDIMSIALSPRAIDVYPASFMENANAVSMVEYIS
jgi:hypothetical protein